MEQDILTLLGYIDSLKARLRELLRWQNRESMQVSIICVDIDHMKHFNLHNGHVAGDNLLREVAELMDGGIDRPHSLFRVGGDEFIEVIESCSRDIAMQHAERIRSAIRDSTRIRQVEHCGDAHCMGPAPVSASIGVVTLEQGDELDADALIAQVRDKMTEAKQAGRDHVCN